MSLNVTYHGDIKYCVALKNCNIFSVVVRAILKAESLEGDDPNFMKALPPLLNRHFPMLVRSICFWGVGNIW